MTQLTPEATTVLSLDGVLESHEWEELRDSIIEAAGVDTTAVVLDMSKVTFFDSRSIRALLSARTALQSRGVTIHLGRCSPMVRLVVDVTGIGPAFPPLPTD